MNDRTLTPMPAGLAGLLGCLGTLAVGAVPPEQDPLEEAAEHAERAVEETVGALEAVARAARQGVGRLEEQVRSAARDAGEVVLDLGGSVAAPGEVRVLRTDAAAPEWIAVPGEMPERVVLLVHGLDEPGSIWDDLAPALRASGYAVARFDFPNDQPIGLSADMLALALADLRGRGTARVDLVCHSMGGLMARDVLTRGEWYGGQGRGHELLPDVERLVLLGTPNGGSSWARLRGVSEARELWMRWIEEPADVNRLLGGFSDGNGEAGHDLLPGSAYLTDLNSRPHPQGVAITAVVGRMAPAELPVPDASAWPLVSNWVTPEHVDAARGAAEDVADDLGDGVVPVESARLEGIRDIVEIEGNHRGMVRRIEALETVRELVGGVSGEPPAIAIVLDRLARPVEAADVAPAE